MIRKPIVSSSASVTITRSKAPSIIKRLARSDRPQVETIIDSGAYSAWRLNKPIKLDEYCDYLLDNLDWMSHYVCLDVINPKSPEDAAAASYENLKYMRSRGLDPVPVFHVGESVEWLYRMLDLGSRYIGLSASSLVSRSQVDDWYALAWSHLVDDQGMPLAKCHAFGEGRFESLRKFPWMSGDSTSWIYTAERAGTMRLTDGRKVAMRNDGMHATNAPDIGQLDDVDIASLLAFAAEEGITDLSAFYDRSTDARALRLYMTAAFYRNQTARISEMCPISYVPTGLFNGGLNAHAKAISDPYKIDELSFYLVIGGNALAYAACAYAKHHRILVSYFHINSMAHNKGLSDYVYDPLTTANSFPAYAEYSKILEKYIK